MEWIRGEWNGVNVMNETTNQLRRQRQKGREVLQTMHIRSDLRNRGKSGLTDIPRAEKGQPPLSQRWGSCSTPPAGSAHICISASPTRCDTVRCGRVRERVWAALAEFLCVSWLLRRAARRPRMRCRSPSPHPSINDIPSACDQLWIALFTNMVTRCGIRALLMKHQRIHLCEQILIANRQANQQIQVILSSNGCF